MLRASPQSNKLLVQGWWAAARYEAVDGSYVRLIHRPEGNHKGTSSSHETAAIHSGWWCSPRVTGETAVVPAVGGCTSGGNLSWEGLPPGLLTGGNWRQISPRQADVPTADSYVQNVRLSEEPVV